MFPLQELLVPEAPISLEPLSFSFAIWSQHSSTWPLCPCLSHQQGSLQICNFAKVSCNFQGDLWFKSQLISYLVFNNWVIVAVSKSLHSQGCKGFSFSVRDFHCMWRRQSPASKPRHAVKFKPLALKKLFISYSGESSPVADSICCSMGIGALDVQRVYLFS